MDLQQLRYLVALAKELNFQRAARSVGISQPTLSQQLKKLENELGRPLFERSPHSVKLTQAGEKFLPHALTALESLKIGATELQENEKRLQGIVKLGFIPTVGPYLLPAVIQELRKKAPQIKLELFEETTSVLISHLKEGKFDIALLALPIDDSSVVSKSFGSEEFHIAVSQQNPLAQKKNLSLKDIQECSLLILKEGHCFREQALDFCKRQGRHPQVTFEGSSLVSVMKLVASGNDITFVPAIAKQGSAVSGLKYIPFKNPKPTRELGVIWRMTMPLNRAQAFVIDSLERSFKNQKPPIL